jgi:hypothetical protein
VKRSTIIRIVYILFLFSLVAIFLGVYGRSLFIRSKQLYRYAKHNRRGWSGSVFQPDRELGFRAKPGANGAHTFPIGENLPMRFNKDGFRVPVNCREDEYKRPYLLALGCSFTYGDACLAEDTFPHLVAQALGGTELNAGLCSYGLSQMLILARKWIPEYKPEYILFQYSPWLLNRSTRKFAPTWFSLAPNPYFINAEDGSIDLHPPVFTCYTVDLTPWRDTPASYSDFLNFFSRVGLPLGLHDEFNMLLFKIKSALSLVPKPSQRKDSIIENVYQEINDLAEKYDSQLIIVGLGNLNEPLVMPESLLKLGLTTINCHSELLNRLEDPTKYAYCQAYAHYRGDPPKRVDRHPNPAAHRIIADSIVEVIRNNNNSKSNRRDEKIDN